MCCAVSWRSWWFEARRMRSRWFDEWVFAGMKSQCAGRVRCGLDQ